MRIKNKENWSNRTQIKHIEKYPRKNKQTNKKTKQTNKKKPNHKHFLRGKTWVMFSFFFL
jgi:hypothetical protein